VDASEKSEALVSPPRVYKRSWEPHYWRGSVDQAVSAARAAEAEIRRQRPNAEQQQHVSVSYRDGSGQGFESLSAFEMALASISPKEVEGFSITVGADNEPNASVRISGRQPAGLTVTTEGSEAFAAGILATLKSRLAGGAEAGDRAARLPIQPVEIIVPLVPLGLAVGLYFYLDGQFTYTDTVGVLLLPIFLLLMAWTGIGGWIGFRREGRKPPPLVLVEEGEQFADEGEPGNGPIWRAQRWFDRHPAIRWGGTLLLGALLGALASKIL
jgi:hypothetical protein